MPTSSLSPCWQDVYNWRRCSKQWTVLWIPCPADWDGRRQAAKGSSPKNQHTALVITSPWAHQEQNSELHREDKGCSVLILCFLTFFFLEQHATVRKGATWLWLSQRPWWKHCFFSTKIVSGYSFLLVICKQTTPPFITDWQNAKA